MEPPPYETPLFKGHLLSGGTNFVREKMLTYRVVRNVCGSFSLRFGDFLCFAGTTGNFCDYDRSELTFAIFRRYPVPSIDNVLFFIEYLQ